MLSESVRQRLIGRGREPESIVVTGNPEFDALWDHEIAVEAKALRKERGWSGKKVILWASQPEPEESPFLDKKGDPELPSNIEKELKSFVKDSRDFILLIRPHPSECREPVVVENRIFWSGQDEPINIVLHSVDVVVTMTSSVGLQAHLISKPVVTVDLSVGTEVMPLSEMGVSHGVTDIDVLGDAIISSMETGPLTTGGFLNKGASSRVVNVIDELLAI